MVANRSPAVMQRRDESAASLDYYPTPPWATHALIRHGPVTKLEWTHSVLEPAAGGGHMYDVLREYFREVDGQDVADPEGRNWPLVDFLKEDDPNSHDWVITNPPFNLASEFALAALKRARVGVALLARLSLLEGSRRHDRLFKPHPPSLVLVFSERLTLYKGRLAEPGESGGASAHAWFVWFKGQPFPSTRVAWVPPGTREV